VLDVTEQVAEKPATPRFSAACQSRSPAVIAVTCPKSTTAVPPRAA
jgi:hypothetical protein